MQLLTSYNINSKDKNLINEIIVYVKNVLDDAKIKIPHDIPLEISHHYGLSMFMKYGCVLLNIINRAYCKKIIIVFPGQSNPRHTHKIKEETFQVLNGSLAITIENEMYVLNNGDLFTIKPEIAHSFSSETGCVFEEISTNHMPEDSYYEDQTIATQKSSERKTLIFEWQL